MKEWIAEYKAHFIRRYFWEEPDLGFRLFHILLAILVAIGCTAMFTD